MKITEQEVWSKRDIILKTYTAPNIKRELRMLLPDGLNTNFWKKKLQQGV